MSGKLANRRSISSKSGTKSSATASRTKPAENLSVVSQATREEELRPKRELARRLRYNDMKEAPEVAGQLLLREVYIIRFSFASN